MSVKAFIFDMDGTVLHTLPDLALITNMTMRERGYPEHTEHEVLTYVGNGAERLVEQACPPGTPAEDVQATLQLWRNLYLKHGDQLTQPFPGMLDALRQLRARGMKTAVLSNKFDAAVKALSDVHFPGLMDISRGEIPPIPRKPDPTSLLQVVEELGVELDEALYVGDTGVDLQVARNAHMGFIGVSWGYDEAIPLPVDELDAYIHHPSELLGFVG